MEFSNRNKILYLRVLSRIPLSDWLHYSLSVLGVESGQRSSVRWGGGGRFFVSLSVKRI